MRIIFDGGYGSRIQPIAPIVRGGRGESVLIVSAERTRAAPGAAAPTGLGAAMPGAAPAGLRSSTGDYEVRISDEALARDREVRAHENSHLAALGGAAASPVMYDTRTGPGGEKVAVGGKIAVDLAEVPGDPSATLRKARAVIAAANAPGDPSAADMRTAARAYALARDARAELRSVSRLDISE